MICWATLAAPDSPSRLNDAQILDAFIMMRGKSRVRMVGGKLAEVTVGAKGVPSTVERLGWYQISPRHGWSMVRSDKLRHIQMFQIRLPVQSLQPLGIFRISFLQG
jgi:hypothetical protein